MTKVIEYYLGELYLVAPAFYCWDIPAVYVGPSSSFLVVVVVLGNWPPRFTTVQLNLNPFSGHFWTRWKTKYFSCCCCCCCCWSVVVLGNNFFSSFFIWEKIVVISVCAINAIVRRGVYDLAGNRFTICPRRIFFLASQEKKKLGWDLVSDGGRVRTTTTSEAVGVK